MIYYLNKGVDRERFKVAANNAVKKGLRVELTVKRAGKTVSQNNYVHLLFRYYGAQVGLSWREVEYDFKQTHPDLFRYTRQGREYWRSLADLDKEEHSIAIKRFIEEVEANGYAMPRIENQEFIDEAQNYVEQHKHYV